MARQSNEEYLGGYSRGEFANDYFSRLKTYYHLNFQQYYLAALIGVAGSMVAARSIYQSINDVSPINPYVLEYYQPGGEYKRQGLVVKHDKAVEIQSVCNIAALQLRQLGQQKLFVARQEAVDLLLGIRRTTKVLEGTAARVDLKPHIFKTRMVKFWNQETAIRMADQLAQNYITAKSLQVKAFDSAEALGEVSWAVTERVDPIYWDLQYSQASLAMPELEIEPEVFQGILAAAEEKYMPRERGNL